MKLIFKFFSFISDCFNKDGTKEMDLIQGIKKVNTVERRAHPEMTLAEDGTWCPSVSGTAQQLQ